MEIMDLLKSQLSGQVLEGLTKQIGADNSQQTATAASGILSTLLGALAKNSQTPDGAAAISNAIEKDHDGSIFDNMSDFLGGKAQVDPRAGNGAGILKHILGGNQGTAASMISKMSGLSTGQTGSLMTTLAPIVMGMLGKQKRTQGLDSSGLSSVLGGFLGNQQKQRSKNPMMGMISGFLDQDGDGSIMDDVGGMLFRYMVK